MLYLPHLPSIKVSTRHQISIPSAARRQLGIQPGDRLDIEVRGDALVLRRRSERASDRLWGLGKHVWGDVDPVGFVRALRDEFDRDSDARMKRAGDDAR